MDYPISLRDEAFNILRTCVVSFDEEISYAAHFFTRRFPVEVDIGFYDVYQRHVYLTYFLVHQSAAIMALGERLKIKVANEHQGQFTLCESYIQNNPIGSYEEFEADSMRNKWSSANFDPSKNVPVHSVAVPQEFINWVQDLCCRARINNLNAKIMDHALDLQGFVASKIDRVCKADAYPNVALVGYDALNTMCSPTTSNIFTFHFAH